MIKRLLKLFRKNVKVIPDLEPSILINDSIVSAEHKTFTETGSFIKAKEFELIWIDKNVKSNYMYSDTYAQLDDDEYIDYMIWEDMNRESLFKKYLPNTLLICGKNPNIIFHGGCLGCKSQRLHGLERCKGCSYFRHSVGKYNLHIGGEEADTIIGDEIMRIIEGKNLNKNN